MAIGAEEHCENSRLCHTTTHYGSLWDSRLLSLSDSPTANHNVHLYDATVSAHSSKQSVFSQNGSSS